MNYKSGLRFGLLGLVILLLTSSSMAQAQVFPRLSNIFSRVTENRFCNNGFDFCSGYGQVYEGVRRSIFNGNDLTGWTNVKGEAPGDGWKVEDGAIYREKNTGDLYLEGEHENFILEFEFKISEKGNSGVKYRSWNTSGYGLGCEYQIYDDINDEKNPPRYQTASLYDVIVPREGTKKKFVWASSIKVR